MVFVLRCDQLEARKGKLHMIIGSKETLFANVVQREFELNYDHLDQRHGTPAMGA